MPIRLLKSGASTADSRIVGFGGAFGHPAAGRQRAERRVKCVMLIGAAWLFGMNCRTRYACETFFNGMRAMIDPTLSEHSERVAKQEGRTSTR